MEQNDTILSEMQSRKNMIRDTFVKARDVLDKTTLPVREKVGAAGEQANQYVHDNPWYLAAAVGLVGVAIGLLIARKRD